MSGPILSPLLPLLGLLILFAVIRRFSMAPGASPTASGAIVMAGGIAILDALQRVPLPIASITRWAALSLFAIAAFIAWSDAGAWMRGTFHWHTDVPGDRFGIGTWVAGGSLLAETVLLAFPGWRTVAIVLAVLSLLVWLWFLTVIARAFREIVPSPARHHVTGYILLSTVATQAVAIVAPALFPGEVPRPLLAVPVILGYLLYVLGASLVAQRYRPDHSWSLADDWDTSNCILHGAMSISGLAGIVTGVLPSPWIDATWLWVAAVFLMIEGIELARARSRVRRYGWRKGLLTYHVSQWARNFTFGMFYAFTLHLPPAARYAIPLIAMLRTPIVGYGQYLVLGLLLFETALFIRTNMRWPAGGIAGALYRGWW